MLHQLLGKGPSAALLIGLIFLIVGCGSGDPVDTTVDLVIENQAFVGVSTVAVKHGDTLTLNVTSDQAGSIHVHGYDIMRALEAGVGTTFTFTTVATGQFDLEFHFEAAPHKHEHEHAETEVTVGVLIVSPR